MKSIEYTMYLPEQFEENRTEVLIDFIQNHALGCLIVHANGELEANHLPFEYDADQHVLLAHIAKKNPLYQLLQQPQQALVVFTINDAYVSPNWYEGKFEHHRTVPTWNYVVIHVKGEVSLIEDEKALRGILAKLTRHHEAQQEKPWKMGDAPSDYIQDQLQQIVGVQIEIQNLIGKFKLSQNRSEQDIRNVASAYQQNGQSQLSELMLKALNE